MAKVISPLISALAGLGGVWLGAWSTAKREIAREERDLSIDRAYLSAYLSVELEKFADGCLYVASDVGLDDNGSPAGENGERCPTTKYPQFLPAAVEGNWKSLSVEILDRVLSISYRVEQHKATVTAYSDFAFPPDYAEFFVARRYCFARLGLEIVTLIDDLRKEAGLPKADREIYEWSRENRLQNVYDEFKAKME
ncbi:hypothetical protein IB233_02130 [Comamonas sp. CMM01]|uniref:hypothetical protein n=1 Tax=Comamonas sp. CMM01 TaxID=2769280 RepID=UPI00178271C9|nr:hypothetical protein [Comamonas sp. CMM01]MBD9530430.1 hypothetical protein [Comamonas sp. CMM01]